MNKLLLLSATAFPGLTRVIGILLIEKGFSSDRLGAILSDINIITLMTFFTSVGWCSLLINRVSQENDVDEKIKIFYGFVLSSMPILFVAILSTLIMIHFKVINYGLAAILYLLSFSLYQLIRHFYFSINSITKLLIIDISIFIFMLLSFYLSLNNYVDSQYIFVIPLIIVCLLWVSNSLFYQVRKGKAVYSKQRDIFYKSQLFGLSNLASGGMVMLLVPLAAFFVENKYSALIGVIVSILGIIIIFPRAITNSYLPRMSKLFKSNKIDEMKKIITRYRMFVFFSLLGLTLCTLTLVNLLAPVFLKDLYELDYSEVLFLLLLLNMFIGQLFLPDASVLVVEEKGKLSLVINAFVFLLLLIGIFFVYQLLVPAIFKIIIIVSVMVILQVFKGFFMLFNTVNFFRQY